MKLLLLFGYGLVIAGVLAWLSTTDGGTLRQQLTQWQFWALETQFVFLVALSWLNIPNLFRSQAIPKRTLFRIAAISLLTMVLAAGVAPKTNRIYYDEHIYQGAGQNLSDLRLAQMCNEGVVEYGRLQCVRGEYDKHPYGYPYLLSVAYPLVSSESTMLLRQL